MNDRIYNNLEVLLALEILEYHDRNYLSNDMANPEKANKEKRRLISEALVARNAEITSVKT